MKQFSQASAIGLIKLAVSQNLFDTILGDSV